MSTSGSTSSASGFRKRSARTKDGKLFVSFLPAISKPALNKISAEVRSWRLHHRKHLTEKDLARKINPIVRGWMQYYGAFYRSALHPLLERINAYLMRWIARNTSDCGARKRPEPRGPERSKNDQVLRALGLDQLRPHSLVTRTTRAV